MVKNRSMEEKKETFAEVFRRNDATFSMCIPDGFVNISFDEKGEMTARFLNEEGYSYSSDETDIPIEAIEKVSKFIADLKKMRLNEFSK